MTFWDLVAPFYNFFERFNRAYRKTIEQACVLVPKGASVLELAAGTGNFSIAVSEKAGEVLCTDISDNMLKVARRRAKDRTNIEFAKASIFDTRMQANSYDVVIASQILHLLDEPGKAAKEIRRVAKDMAILPMPLLKQSSRIGRFLIGLYKIVGFKPKHTFDEEGYKAFMERIGFDGCEFYTVKGSVSICTAVWRK